jgi:hypothetical protein
MSIHEPEDTGEQSANDGGTPQQRRETGADEQYRLACTLVRYDGEPDRVTVYPPDATSVDRMATWLSADADACLDIERMR